MLRSQTKDLPKNEQIKQTLQLDGSEEERNLAKQIIGQYITDLKPDGDEREKIYRKRRDFFSGNHHMYTNVVGLQSKEKQGHILAVFNYIWRMSTRLTQALCNSPMRFKIKPDDEASEIESIRAESEENWIYKVLKDNKFFSTTFRRASTIQVRDADFAVKVFVESNERDGKKITVTHAENMEKLYVVYDDTSGTSYSLVIYRDRWTLDKIKREFNGYEAAPIVDDPSATTTGQSDHSDPFGVHSGGVRERKAPSGISKVPQAWVSDGWGWFKVINDDTKEAEWKMCNITMIGDDVVQFVKTDYEYNPWIIGHSFDNPGSPWSIGFIDNLIDPQTELNDRTSEEGDMIRIGANQKYVVINMPNFDASSVKPGSGQVIYIEGENADFKPLETNVNPFPSETYINRSLEHMFALGLPKIALATGTAPYTGKVGAIQYQPVSDLVDELRSKWAPVLEDVVKRIQSYTRMFFPEIADALLGYDENMGEDYPTVRDVEFEWDSVLPQSQSENIIDGATLFDRDVLPIKRLLEKAGYQDPMAIIKELKREARDPEIAGIRSRFRQLSRGVVQATLEARRESMEAEEATGANMGAMQDMVNGAQKGMATMPANRPMLHKDMNDGRRGAPATAGVPGVGQTASPEGSLIQQAQNMRAAAGGQ